MIKNPCSDGERPHAAAWGLLRGVCLHDGPAATEFSRRAWPFDVLNFCL